MAKYEGVSRASSSDAGFKAATQAAVEEYKKAQGTPAPGKPVRLRVAKMYVRVENPIHEFIVVLGTDRRWPRGSR
jgi:hypothetical protein